MQAAIAGFALGMSLILAIGAQNAFVLRQGLQRQHVLAVCLTCALSDAILISAGVFGFGNLLGAIPSFQIAIRLAGAAFLFWYGWRSFRSAWAGGHALEAGKGALDLRSALLTCLALSWLNPHVYIDTVLILGTVSAHYPQKAAFALGAIVASFVFFFALGYGARMLAPVFARPSAWRVLDGLIGALMWIIAFGLLRQL